MTEWVSLRAADTTAANVTQLLNDMRLDRSPPALKMDASWTLRNSKRKLKLQKPNSDLYAPHPIPNLDLAALESKALLKLQSMGYGPRFSFGRQTPKDTPVLIGWEWNSPYLRHISCVCPVCNTEWYFTAGMGTHHAPMVYPAYCEAHGSGLVLLSMDCKYKERVFERFDYATLRREILILADRFRAGLYCD